MPSRFPSFITDFLTEIGFYQENAFTLSFVPKYQWEKFSLSITECGHYRFEIFQKDSLLPKRIIFTGYRVENKEALIFLLSKNADFIRIWEKLEKRLEPA